jgi:hypothetical protein
MDKGCVWEWECGEVGLDIGVDDQLADSSTAGYIGQRVGFASLIHKHGARVCFVEPEHPAAAAGV